MSHGLSKSRLMMFRQCPKRLWLYAHRRDVQEFSEETETRFQIGFQVGALAQTLHPNGILIDTADAAEALEWTQQALNAHPDRPVFEAAFARNDVLVRADVVLPEDGGYRLREVKASTSVKPEHYPDGAIQSWVVQGSMALTGVEIAHVDNTFVYPGGGDYRGLLKAQVLDAALVDLLPQIPAWVAQARATLAGPEPDIAPGDHCTTPYECPFQHHCKADEVPPDYPLNCLPRLQGKRFTDLVEQGITDVRAIPSDYPLTRRQAWVVRVIQSGQAERDPEAARRLQSFGYPRYYLDFETFQVAVPLWPGTRPYQQLPVQWSCHVETAGQALRHGQFIADGLDDPRRAFAEQLLATVGETGPVFVYNRSFEVGRLQELAQGNPDLAPGLMALIARVVDLKTLTEQFYCHPAMKGRWSLKAVLPTVAPELAYDDLAIGDGAAASEAWQEIYHPETSEARRATLYTELSQYCARDTLALVRLAHFLSAPA